MKAGLVVASATASFVSAADQPQWGQAWSRNLASQEKGLPDSFDPRTGKNVLWQAELGTDTYSTPVVARGRVYIGTNNNRPRNKARTGDSGVLMCFDERDGKLLWQLVVPKRWEDQYLDWYKIGLCSTATVDGDRVYVVSSRGEVICLDAAGMANGNDGPFTDEAALATSPKEPGQQPKKTDDGAVVPEPLSLPKVEGARAEVSPLDADVIWRTDLAQEAGIWPHDSSHSSSMVLGDHLYLNSGTGVDYTHRRIRAPKAPSLLVLDKKTGRVLARDAVEEGIGPNIFHNTYAGPALGVVGGRQVIFFCAGNGIVYGFEPIGATPPEGTVLNLKKVFQFDPDPSAPKTEVQKYHQNRREGPSNFYGMPVFVDGHLYFAGGGDVYWGKNEAWLKCLTFDGGADKPLLAWTHELNKHTLSSVAVADGLAYVTDSEGNVHCVDAKTGATVWVQPMDGAFWSSPLVADGKVFAGTRRGEFGILAAGREKKVLSTIKLGAGAINSTATAANGVVFFANMTTLYALKVK